ncbi:MAG TPA: hypothetical protein VEQ10_18825 [Vicinamibacteria bacterium]|nr:hypothetical protein [Vicinamibacteria bacterium]
MTPPLRRVLASLALLAGDVAVLVAGLVLLAACQREITARPTRVQGAEPRSAVLRVCVDPNGLPFPNEPGARVENRRASLPAEDRRPMLRYERYDQRPGFVREGRNAAGCDLIMGVPTSHGRLLAPSNQ